MKYGRISYNKSKPAIKDQSHNCNVSQEDTVDDSYNLYSKSQKR